MKKILMLMAMALPLAASGAENNDTSSKNVLSSPAGHFVLGSIETKYEGKTLYLLDTKTGQVWLHGCIAWGGQDNTCTFWGFRPVYASDGAGEYVFSNVAEAQKMIKRDDDRLHAIQKALGDVNGKAATQSPKNTSKNNKQNNSEATQGSTGGIWGVVLEAQKQLEAKP